MERLRIAECTHANQTDALRVAIDDLHNASAVISTLRNQVLLLIRQVQTY